MSSKKAEYPHRPTRRGRPKASEHIHSRRKTWLSDVSSTDGRQDTTPLKQAGLSWWKSPMMKAARLRKWGRA